MSDGKGQATAAALSAALAASESLEPAVAELLAAAVERARLTLFPRVEAAHLVHVLLSRDDGPLAALLAGRCGGLAAAKVAGSLLDVLEVAGELAEETPAASLPAAGPPEPEHLAPSALAALRRAGELAAGRITDRALTRALLEAPDDHVAEAFGDWGVSAADLAALAAAITETDALPALPAPAVLAGGHLDPRALGPLAQAAFARLAAVAAARPDPLRDVDLLAALIEQPESLLAEALYVLGVPVESIRRALAQAADGLAVGTVGMGGPMGTLGMGAAQLPEARLGRLLRQVLERAADLAGEEGCAAVGESQLVRAHLERVGGGAGNLYQRLGIDTRRLAAALARHRADRAAPASQASTAPVDVESLLRARVLHQDHAVRRVLPALARLRSGLAEPGRPLGVFLFLGPPGVGKTELARAIAEVAFGADEEARDAHLIKLDCGSFVERRDIVQLLGAPQGLVGYKEGQLTNGLREKPRSVILFDEAEKADRHIWQSLLPLFEDGVVREADGTEADATGCIVIATSNKGYQEALAEVALWQEPEERFAELQPRIEEIVWRHVEQYFSPEFRSRFGRENILYFHCFRRSSYRDMLRQQADRLAAEMARRGLRVEVADDAIELLADLAWQRREEGARPVRRLLTEHVRDRVVAAVVADPGRTRFRFAALEGPGTVQLEAEPPAEGGA